MENRTPLYIFLGFIIVVVLFFGTLFVYDATRQESIETTTNSATNTTTLTSALDTDDWVPYPYLGNRLAFYFSAPEDWSVDSAASSGYDAEDYEGSIFWTYAPQSEDFSGLSLSVMWYDATGDDLDTWAGKHRDVLAEVRTIMGPVEELEANTISFRRVCTDGLIGGDYYQATCDVMATDGTNIILLAVSSSTQGDFERVRSYSSAFMETFNFLRRPTDDWVAFDNANAGYALMMPPDVATEGPGDSLTLFMGDDLDLTASAVPGNTQSPIEYWFTAHSPYDAVGKYNIPSSVEVNGFSCIQYIANDTVSVVCDNDGLLYHFSFPTSIKPRNAYSILNTLTAVDNSAGSGYRSYRNTAAGIAAVYPDTYQFGGTLDGPSGGEGDVGVYFEPPYELWPLDENDTPDFPGRVTIRSVITDQPLATCLTPDGECAWVFELYDQRDLSSTTFLGHPALTETYSYDTGYPDSTTTTYFAAHSRIFSVSVNTRGDTFTDALQAIRDSIDLL